MTGQEYSAASRLVDGFAHIGLKPLFQSRQGTIPAKRVQAAAARRRKTAAVTKLTSGNAAPEVIDGHDKNGKHP